HVDGRFIPFPTQDELEESDLDLIVSGSKNAVLMIEGFAREMPEELMAEAIAECQRIIGQICELQEELFAKVGVQKAPFTPAPPSPVYEQLKSRYYDQFKTIKQTEGKQLRATAVKALKEKVLAEMIPDSSAPGAISPLDFESA